MLTPVGPTGVDINGSTGFDVSASAAGFVSATGIAFFNSRLYTIDLGTGAMTFVGALGSSGTTRYTAISVVPSGVLSVSDAVVTEDGSAALVRVDRTGGSLGAVSATLSPADGSATAGGDYDATPRTVAFSNGDTSETALIPIANDGVAEPRETFTVNLSAPTGGADIGRGAGTVTIVDEDANAPDTARPAVALAGIPRSMRLRKFLRGVSMRVTPNEPVSLESELRASARRARIAAFNLTLGTRALPLAAGTRVVRLRLSRRVRRVIGRPPRRFRPRSC
ncbi:MAG TPA: Calx-beta domain-containing protein [Thermoleophilaceae bacterium]